MSENQTNPQKLDPKFNIYTAIDILEEKCVRLQQGDFDISTTYNKDPIFVAKRWKSLGAKFLHVVDLDGARSGLRRNFSIIEKIILETKMPVQVGGGIRKLESVERYLKAGAARVIFGSTAVKEPEVVKQALSKFGGDKVLISLDCRNGHIAVEGWKESSQLSAVSLVRQYESSGLKYVVFTDIEKDGTLSGPNLEELENLAKQVKVNIISSGGISSISDVKDIKDLQKKYSNINGTIVGKALYANTIHTKDLYTEDIYN